MKFLGLVLLLLIVLGIVGLFLGWFSVASQGTDGKTNVTITVDKNKLEEDAQKAKAKLQDLQHQATDKLETPTRTDRN